jgi:hypothetical protein
LREQKRAEEERIEYAEREKQRQEAELKKLEVNPYQGEID